jgi:hypothetical protein
MLHYYFYEPNPLRLMRAWKNLPGIRQVHGGHRLAAEHPLAVFPEPFVLRHYVVLSQDHANTKYLERRFAPEDLVKGWHSKRLHVPPQVPLPEQGELDRLASGDSKDFCKRFPRRYHFWEPGWEKRASPGPTLLPQPEE